MEKLFTYLFIFLFINSYVAKSQDSFSDDKWREYVEEFADDSGDEEGAESLYADLSYIVQHPLDINLATREQLERLPFLSDNQIESLLNHRKRYGGFVSLYELQGVDGFDNQTIQLILPFVRVGGNIVEKTPPTVENLLKYGKNELVIRYDYCFQQKAGYSSYPDSILSRYPNRKYLGEPFYTSLRYSYSFDDYIQSGLVAEKDMGEPFWKPQHKGYDFYSFHFLLRERKWLKTLALGDYKMSFGQGLVVSNDFTPSRSALVTQIERRNNGFRRHYSTNEIDFFRGIAATTRFGNFNISAFYSRRKMDAALEGDTFPSIQTTGLHRLQRDYAKRKKITMQSYGGNIRFMLPDINIGFTALHYDFCGKYLQPEPRLYNVFNFKGEKNVDISMDYLLKTRYVRFFGETARSGNGAWATLDALELMPTSYLTVLLLYRNYGCRYQAYFANAFSQGSVQNERGFYFSLRWLPHKHWQLSGYADIFRFPWLRYGINSPSGGKEYMLQSSYTRNDDFEATLRYKCKSRDESYTRHSFRLQFSLKTACGLVCRSSMDAVLYAVPGQTTSRGYMIGQNAGWKSPGKAFGIDCFLAYFQTDGYYTRISSYEKNILYAFSLPSFYGKGIRAACTFRWEINGSLSLSAKLANTFYADRSTIGSETEAIMGKNKTDLYALLCWKF